MNWNMDTVSGRTLMIGFKLDSEGKEIDPNLQYSVARSDEGELIIVRQPQLVLDEYNIGLKHENRLS